MSGPYSEAAWTYWAAGWRGVLPLPAASKGPPPGGYTGWAGVEPSGADVQAWIDDPERAGANIALRLPEGVYGLDVDAYGEKQGAAALAAAQTALGSLPPTWIVTSRDDGVSGIRMFRASLDVGRRWRDEPTGHGRGVEAIHLGHRYAVVWPSTHPETGRKYVWYDPEGCAPAAVPRLDELPELPAAWVEALSEPGEIASGEAAGHAETVEVVRGFPEGEACDRLREARARALQRLREARDGAALHPAARNATHELTRLGHEGHAGARRALAEHYAAFVDVRVKRGEDQRAAEREWWRLARGAVGKLAGPARDACDCALLSGEGLLFEWSPGEGARAGDDTSGGEWDDPFWTARETLSTIRDTARLRMVSPWATLGGVLALACSQIGPHVVLPGIVGGPASLNLFVALVGGSGAGKDAALTVAGELLPSNLPIPRHEVGTGQGIDSTYTCQIKDAGAVQHCDAALFTVTEIDTLASHAGMTGSNIMPTLRKVYSGSDLGARYADKAKRRPVSAHRYRAALIAGVQPARAGVLLADSDGGTPQRWLWLPTNDPGAAMWRPPEAFEAVTGSIWERTPDWSACGDMGDGMPVPQRPRIVLGVCETAHAAVVAARRERLLAGLGDEVGRDGHALLTQLKVAALLGLLDGRPEASEDDWTLAGWVMRVSAIVRESCSKALTSSVHKVNQARALAEVERAEIMQDRTEQRAAATVLRALKKRGGWVPRAEARRALVSAHRGHFEAAAERLEAAGQIEVKESERSVNYRAL